MKSRNSRPSSEKSEAGLNMEEKTDAGAIDDVDLRQAEGLDSTWTQMKRPSPWQEAGDQETEPQAKIARPSDELNNIRLMTRRLSTKEVPEIDSTNISGPSNFQDSTNKMLASGSPINGDKEKTDGRIHSIEGAEESRADSSRVDPEPEPMEIGTSEGNADNPSKFQEAEKTEGEAVEPNANIQNILPDPDAYTVLASDFESASCLQCGEEFDTFYESDEDEWRLRDALAANDSEGKPGLFHPTCHEDYLALLAGQAATASMPLREANESSSSHRNNSVPVTFELDVADSMQEDHNVSESAAIPNGTVSEGEPPSKCRGKAKRKTEGKKQSENPKFWTEGVLTREEVSCTICFGIFLEPVSLPCKHTVCLECYRKHVDVTSLYCPICRFRLSVWSRRASKENSLINVPFWERIRQQFPEQIANRIAGIDVEPFTTPSSSPLKRDGTMAGQGEILHEFKAGLEQFEQEMELERRKEEEASKQLILQLQEEEPQPPAPQSPTQLQADFEFARKLQEAVEREERERQQQQRASRSNIEQRQGQAQELGRSQEEEASEELIRQLQEQEPPPPPPQSSTQLQADFELAKRLQEEADREERKKQKENAELRRSTRKVSSGSGNRNNGKQNNRKT